MLGDSTLSKNVKLLFKVVVSILKKLGIEGKLPQPNKGHLKYPTIPCHNGEIPKSFPPMIRNKKKMFVLATSIQH